jgi:hypothetical protein
MSTHVSAVGRQYYRVVVAGDADHLGGRSRTIVVSVR